MPEAVAAPAAATSTTAQPSTTTTSQPTTTAEPQVSWAGVDDQKTTATETGNQGQQDTAADTGAEDDWGADDDVELGLGEDEFGDAETESTTFPKDLKDRLNSQDPAVAKAAEKQLKKWFFENQRFKSAFKSPEEASQLLEKIEGFGGLEGIERERGEWAKIDDLFAKGDASVIDIFAQQNQEGLVKIAPEFVDKWQKMDPAGWNHSMASVFMATVRESGMLAALQALQSDPALANNANLRAVLEKIGVIDGQARKAPTRDLSPQTEKLKQQENSLAQQKFELHKQSVGQQVAPIMKKAAISAIKSVVHGVKIGKEGRAELIKSVQNEYSALARADVDYQAKLTKLLRSGDTDKFIKMVNSHFQLNMGKAAQRAWKKVRSVLGEDTKQQRQAEGASRRESGGSGATGNIVKTAPPASSDVDWARMRAEFGRDKADSMFMFDRKYYKKGDSRTLYRF